MKTSILACWVMFMGFYAQGHKEIKQIDLAHKWQITWFSYTSFLREIERFPKAEKEAYQKKMKRSFIRFKQSGSYSMRFLKTKDDGTWQATRQELILNSAKGAKVKFEIESISETKIKLYQVQKKDTLLMIIER